MRRSPCAHGFSQGGTAIQPYGQQLVLSFDYRDCFSPVRELPPGEWLYELLSDRTQLGVEPLNGIRRRRRGWSCQNRLIDGHWILLVLDGRFRGRLGQREVDLQPGELFWAAPGVPRTVEMSLGFRYAEVHFAIRAIQGQGEDRYRFHLTPHSEVLCVADADPLRSPITRIGEEIHLGGQHTCARVRALLADLCVGILRLADETRKSGTSRRDELTREQQVRLIRLVRERGYCLSPADMAAELKLSSDYFRRQFQKAYGASPKVWLNRQHIGAAAEILDNTGLTVSEVADQMGYAGVPQFSRQFKKVFGLSPSAYRHRRVPTG